MKQKLLLTQFILLLLLITSCSSNNKEEVLNSKELSVIELAHRGSGDKPNNENTFSENNLHLYVLESEFAYLQNIKEKLSDSVEEGDQEAIEDLEQVQFKMAQLEEDITKLGYYRPRFPKLPSKPNPCPKRRSKQCYVKFKRIGYLLFGDHDENISIIIKDVEGNILVKNEDVMQSDFFDEAKLLSLHSQELEGRFILTVSKFSPFLEKEVSYNVNIVF